MATRIESSKKKEDSPCISREKRDRSVERDRDRDRDRGSRHYNDSRDYRRRRRSNDRRYRHTAHDSRRKDKYRRSRSRTRSPVKSRYRSTGAKSQGGSNAVKPASQSSSTEIKLPTFKPKVVLCEKKDDKPITKLWAATTFEQDDGGKIASKFKRLMGLKEDEVPKCGNMATTGREVLKKQAELFTNMEQQYEVARTTTHTMRGVGLGFAK